MDYMVAITQNISEQELLAQLAEEASELAQAALKLRRSMRRENPTPISRQVAKNGLLEEIADVLNCIETVNLSKTEVKLINQIREKKLQRWVDRLNGK